MIKKCLYCSVEFETENLKKIYCSYECQNKYTSRRSRRKSLQSKKDSQEGYNERSWRLMNMTIDEFCARKPNKPRRLVMRDELRSYAGSWNPELKNRPCEICGYDKHTELAHIRPISDFPGSALLKEVHAKTNIRVLCPNCHWEYDNIENNSL